MNQNTEHECCPFCDAYDFYSSLRNTRLDEEECFRSALELFAEKFVDDASAEIYEDGMKEGYAQAHEDMASSINSLALKVRNMTDPCEDCDCEDGDCYR